MGFSIVICFSFASDWLRIREVRALETYYKG